MTTDSKSCSEWLLGQLASAARSRSRVWLQDPDNLLCSPPNQVEQMLGSEKAVLIVAHSIGLRQRLRSGIPNKWVLVDQTPESSAALSLFAPDLRRLVGHTDFFRKSVRDFLVDQTQDEGWPLDVECFPYRELARDNPAAFIRSYDDFRAGKETGFTSSDLLLIAAGAVLGLNLFSLLEPFQVLELAFHSHGKWDRLSEYFGQEEIVLVQEHLSKLRSPLGDLFGSRAQSARLASVALLILSRHLDSPGPYLPNLAASLSAWQDCEPLFSAALPPAWFQKEIDIFDDAVIDSFLKVMKGALALDTPERAQDFIQAKCWSRKLRELALPYDTGTKHPPAAVHEKPHDLEAMVPHFRGILAEVEKLHAIAKRECDQMRCLSPAQLKMSRFVALFKEHGFNRLPLLIAELRDLGERVSAISGKPPGFTDYWTSLQTNGDALIEATESALKDFDFLLGRFLESQYAQAIPAQIPRVNQLLERVIVPSRGAEPDKPVVILLLDGLRYDLWQAIIRPHLERRFGVEEQVGMAVLPSETKISRFGFFSGLKPADYYGKHYPGGEIAACQALLRRLTPGHHDLEEWAPVSPHSSFAFRTSDGKLFGAVLDFADAIGHASAWEIDFLADLVQLWLKKLDQVLNKLPTDCTLWITADHGQVISGASPIEIPADSLLGDGNGYRSAHVRDRIPGPHANHIFYLKARDLGYDMDGFWAFPKPGYSFKCRDRFGGMSRFKPTANMRHSGLSAFEVFVPIARLTARTEEVRVTMVPKPVVTFTVGVPSFIGIEVHASTLLQGQVEIAGNVDGVSPVLVQELGTAPQLVQVPFTPAKAGPCVLQLEARWGFKALPDPVTVSVQVQSQTGRPADALDSKLKKLFGG